MECVQVDPILFPALQILTQKSNQSVHLQQDEHASTVLGEYEVKVRGFSLNSLPFVMQLYKLF